MAPSRNASLIDYTVIMKRLLSLATKLERLLHSKDNRTTCSSRKHTRDNKKYKNTTRSSDTERAWEGRGQGSVDKVPAVQA